MILYENYKFKLYTTDAIYIIENKNGFIRQLGFIPKELEQEALNEIVENANYIQETEAQVNINMEPYQVSASTCQVNCLCSNRAKYQSHTISQTDFGFKLEINEFDEQSNIVITNVYLVYNNSPALNRKTIVTNTGDVSATVEHISSFALYGFPMFGGEGTDLILHQFRSQWAYEGEHHEVSLGELGLLPHFCRNSFHVESNSSFSCLEYFPYFILEDRANSLFWSIQLEHSSFWRFEIGTGGAARDNWYFLSGGMGNFMSSGWQETLQPGESVEGIPCSMAVKKGTLNDILDNLRQHQKNVLIHKSSSDKSNPVIYNEWQNTFGRVSEETVASHMEVLKDCDIDTYVLDAGWFSELPSDRVESQWWATLGDWVPNPVRFPSGIKKTANIIKSNGMKAGIWCEIELAGFCSNLYKNDSMLAKRMGKCAESSGRRFLYFGSQAGRDYADSVFEQLISYGFTYFKIDYNSDAAPGYDNDTVNLRAGLMKNIRGYYQWLDDLRKRHPEVVIENCSSGGLRMEYGMLSRTDLCSITDQESNRYTGEVYYNVSKLIHPSQAANWSTMKAAFCDEEYAYTLINSMMGRIHISGDVQNHNEKQKSILKEGIKFYKKYRHVLEDARLYHHSPDTKYYKNQGAKILELSGRGENEPIIISCVGLSGSKGSYKVYSKFAKENVAYKGTSFPEKEDFFTNGKDLTSGFPITLKEDYRAEIYAFYPCEI